MALNLYIIKTNLTVYIALLVYRVGFKYLKV